MYKASGQSRAAMQELMFLHVDLKERQVVPFREGAQQSVRGALERHRALGLPLEVRRQMVRLGVAI